MPRILVLVPNTATSDRRVIRQSNSLKKAGHTVEIVGITTNAKSATKAITEEQIPVTRVTWRAATYRRLFLVAVSRYARLSVVLGLLAIFAYFVVFRFGYNIFAAQFPAPISLFGLGITPFFAFSILLLGGIFGLFILALCIKLFEKKAMKRSILHSLKNASQVAENYANLEGNASNAPEPMLLRIFKRLSRQQGDGHADSTFRATISSRIAAMTEYGMSWKPDIVYCHEAATLPVGAALKKELNCRLVYEAHEIYDDLANATPIQSQTYQNIHKQNFVHVDHFITVNPRVMDYYLETYPEIERHTVIANTVFLDNTPEYDGRLHEKAKLPGTAKIALYQGGFGHHRGLEKLVDAAVELPDDWYLVMMGWGNLEDELKARAENNKEELIKALKMSQAEEMMASDDFQNKVTALLLKTPEEKIHSSRLESHIAQDQPTDIGDGQSVNTDQMPKQRGTAETNGHIAFKTYDYLMKRYMDTYQGAFADKKRMAKDVASLVEFEAEAVAAAAKTELSAKKATQDQDYRIGYDRLVAEVNTKVQHKISELQRQGFFDKVRFIPGAPHDELVSWSKGATVGIIPYENIGANHWNCSPNKIWEYSNAGTPIVASRMIYLNELIQEHGIGWTFSTDFEASEIALTVRRLDSHDIEQKVQNCKSFIKANNYLVYEPELLAVFEEL